MAQIWTQTNQEEWTPLPLSGEAIYLRGGDGGKLMTQSHAEPRAAILMSDPQIGGAWALLGEPGVEIFVNGVRIVGIRKLEDRDEIRIGRQVVYFSTENPAHIEPHRGAQTICPRCRQPVFEGDPIVRCPRCGIVHHMSEESGFCCWTYAPTCSACDQPTVDVGAEFSWSPAEL